MSISVLQLVEAARDVSRTARPARRQRHLDVVVDGVTLSGPIRQAGLDLVSVLWVDDPTARPHVLQGLDRLLGRLPGDAPHGRVSVYVCPECGDLGCGAVTVRVSVSADLVSWSGWGYQAAGLDEVLPVDEARPEAWSDMTFDRAAYEVVLEAAKARVER